jgi:RHS repeat-associated protein
VARIKHGYDYAGSRLWREDVIAAANSKLHDEQYTYDGLHRVTDSDRGDWNGTTIVSKNYAQEWTLDALGNWPTFKQDNDGDGTWELSQTRTHNKANETLTASSWASPVHDAAGNMTTAPDPVSLGSGLTLTYDAWNRLVKVASGATIYGEYEYDGLHRRIVKIDRKANPDVTYDYYLSESWQVLEVRKDANTTPLEQYVWHPYYVDALALRVYDADTSGAGAPVDHYYSQDANFNVTAVFTSTGAVQERYQYSAYGQLTVLDPNFAVDADGISDIANTIAYTGRSFDAETGMYDYRNRVYHSQLGRFVSRDPITYVGSKWNLYEYVGSSPYIFRDPSGFRTWGEFFDETTYLIGQTGLGLGQGVANGVNGVQDGLIGILNIPASGVNALAAAEEWVGILPENSIRMPYIPSPDWSRDLITPEPGEEGTWTDSHGWSKFGGEAAADLYTGKIVAKCVKVAPKGLAGKSIKELKEFTNGKPWDSLWGRGIDGAEDALKRLRNGDGILPDGIGRDALDAYDEMARRVLDNSDKATEVGTRLQELRRQIIDELRRRGL